MGSLDLYLRDLYPSTGIQETSTEVVPEANDQDALGEDKVTAESVDARTPNSKNIFIGLGLIALLVVFLGVGK